MKKIWIIIALVIIIFAVNNKKEELMIPKEAIRFRVIANSDEAKDQDTKILVRNAIQQQMVEDLEETRSVEEARTSL